MQEWGWSALRGHNVETWALTPKTVKAIASGIGEAVDQETGEEVDPDTTFYIDSYTGRKAMQLTWAQIEAEDFGPEYQPAPAVVPDQVRKLDQAQSPEFYKGNLGDSVTEAQFADAARADPFARHISSGWLLPDDRIRWSRTIGDHDLLARHLGLTSEEHLKNVGGVKLWSDGQDRTITHGSQRLTPRRLRLLKDLAIEYRAALQDEDHNVIEDYRVEPVQESISYGWARGEHVVLAPFADGEDNHHVTHRHLLPDQDSNYDWKRWRFNSDLGTVFWWGAPSREEQKAVKDELGYRAKRHVFVELGSTSYKGDATADRRVPRANLDAMANSDDPIEAGAGNELLDVTHYPDARSDYMRRWLSRVGDAQITMKTAKEIVEALIDTWDGPAEARCCPHCHGEGSIAREPGSSQRYRCTDCKGKGELPTAEKDGD